MNLNYLGLFQLKFLLHVSFALAPATNDDLPDMYETLEGLDTDEIELNMKTTPPSILTNDHQQQYQKQVQDLKQGLQQPLQNKKRNFFALKSIFDIFSILTTQFLC